MNGELIVDAWAQLPRRAGQLVPEGRRLLERSGTAAVLQTGVTSAPPSLSARRSVTPVRRCRPSPAGQSPIETSAYAPRCYPPALVQFAASYAQDRVLFGTNFPQLPLECCPNEARPIELPDGPRQKFFAGNARRVFGL